MSSKSSIQQEMSDEELLQLTEDVFNKVGPTLNVVLTALYGVRKAPEMFNDFFAVYMVGYISGLSEGKRDLDVDRLLDKFFRAKNGE